MRLRRLFYPMSYVLIVPLYLSIALGITLSVIARGMTWLHHGYKFHVYFRIVQARRWCRSDPTWKPTDLRINIGPPGRMPTIEEFEEAFPGAEIEIRKTRGPCGRPDCEACNPKKEN